MKPGHASVDSCTRTLICLLFAGSIGCTPIRAAGHHDEPVSAECPVATLRAYSHNDYLNPHPLVDALAAGFRGVEADVFLIDGALRVGHDRRAAERAGTFESLYVRPLAALVRRCGRLTRAGDAPFLLAVEIKERSRPTYDAVLAVLASHGLTADYVARQAGAPVQVVLVGWHPSDARRADGGLLAVHQRIGGHADTLVGDSLGAVRLLSLDYGKTIGRPWRTAAGRQRWLLTIAAARRNAGGRRLRAHNVPVDSAVYAALLAAGVDVIGTTRLDESRRVLSRLER